MKQFRIVALAISLFIAPIAVLADPLTWERVPLRTAVQVTAGDAGGEGMQMVWDLVFSPNDANTAYMVTDTSRVWKGIYSIGSWSWEPTLANGFYANGGVSMAVYKESEISVSESNSNVLFVAGSTHIVSGLTPKSYGADGIYRSTDGGDNWTQVEVTPFFRHNSTDISAKGGKLFAVDSTTRNIYAGTGTKGVVVSENGGITWAEATWSSSYGLSNYDITDIKMLLDRRMLIIGWMWDPEDPGTWNVKTDGNPDIAMFVVNLAESPSVTRINVTGANSDKLYPRSAHDDPCEANDGNNDSVYVALGDYGVGKLILGSSPTLSILNTGLPAAAVDNVPGGAAVSHLSVVGCTNGIPDAMYVNFFRLFNGSPLTPYVSTDGGANWSASVGHADEVLGDLDLPEHGGMYQGAVIAPYPNSSTKVLTVGSTVMESADTGDNWYYQNTGYTGGRVGGSKWRADLGSATNGFSFQSANEYVAFLTDWGVFSHSGSGAFSPLLSSCIQGFCATRSAPAGAVSSDRLKMVAAIGNYNSQKLIYSVDGGISWSEAKGGSNNLYEDNFKFIKFKSNDVFYANGYKGTFSGSSLAITALDKPIIGIDDSNRLYSSYMDNLGILKLYYSTDDWVNVTNEIMSSSPPQFNLIYGFDQIIVSKNGDRIYVTNSMQNDGPSNSEGVWKCIVSSDQCVWSRLAYPADSFGTVASHALVINPNNSDEVCVGGINARGHSNGVYCTSDFSAWNRPNTSGSLLDSMSVYSLSANPFNGDLYAGTSYGTWVIKNYFYPSNQDTDGDEVLNGADDDDDGDGVSDINDEYPLISLSLNLTDSDADGMPNFCSGSCLAAGMREDLDDDNDELPDDWENIYRAGGEGGCIGGSGLCLSRVDQTDAAQDRDGDGLNSLEEYKLGTSPINKDHDGDGYCDGAGCNSLPLDNCPMVFNDSDPQVDSDNDGVGDVCDDGDGDGLLDLYDNCPMVFNASQADLDNDDMGDVCDLDLDGDSFTNYLDNCPSIANSSQVDTSSGGVGDACDADDDNDDVLDEADNCRVVVNPLQLDLDQDGYGNACDGDVTNDGVVDIGDMRELIASGLGIWVNSPFDDLPATTIPHINKAESEIDQREMYQWAKEGSSYEPGP